MSLWHLQRSPPTSGIEHPLFTPEQVPLPARPSRPQTLEPANEFGNCGIHCIALSPGGELLATGGTEPADCVVLHVPTMQTVQTNIVSSSDTQCTHYGTVRAAGCVLMYCCLLQQGSEP